MDFTDFQEHKMNTTLIAERVLDHTEMLIEALKHNYVEYCIRGHKRSANLADRVEEKAYHMSKIEEVKNHCPIDFLIDTGRKYHRIVFVDGGGQRSVHCFIDKNTGEVYKSASWKSPAKGVRYDLRIIEEREWLLEHADWSGGYLYSK